ncbi:MAG: TonB-dependent receptor [Robiginitomaculum sp.]|nr:TonB-dependent receptor [Robiginitomaculum sp.]MDQ7078174.1 TonB-dependent receptor [Robiginitomaculum sp.]
MSLKSIGLGATALTSLTILLSQGFMTTPAFAQSAREDEIIVTARKRSESLLETPAAISAFTPQLLEDRNISNLDDVGKYVPNLTITRYGVGNTAQAAVFIRGIGLQDHIITTDPGVGVYLDGVYLGRQMGSNLSLSNIERIEVLRGPQGTLYGRNTLGGAVNIITKKPGDEEVVITNVKGGTRGRVAADFYTNFAMSDQFALSTSGAFKRRNGVGDFLNLPTADKRVGEINEFSGRIVGRWEPSGTFSTLFSLDGTSAHNGLSPYTIDFPASVARPDPNNIFNGSFPLLNPSLLPANRDDNNTTVAGLDSTTNRTMGVSITSEWETSENLTAKMIASYRSSDYTGGLDDDATALHLSEFPENGNAQQTSLELQLNGQYGALDFVSGLYYFHEVGETESGPWVFSPFNTPGAVEGFGDFGFFDLNQTTDSYAGFANVKYEFSPRFSGGAGIRYSKDQKDADAKFPTFASRKFLSRSFDAVTWDVNASYNVQGDIYVYGQIQRGYQTGGFPPRPFGGPAQFVSFDKTTSTNFEAGLKGRVSNYLTVMLSAFWTDYNNLALPFSDTTAGGGFVTIISNAGKSRSKGFEAEGTLYLSDNVSINGSLGYMDAKIRQVDPGTIGIGVGDSPALTPKWTVSVAPKISVPLENGNNITFNADYSYRSSMFGQSINNPGELIKSRGLVGFSLDYESVEGGWTIGLYGENIFNEVYDVGRLQQNGFVGVVVSNDRSEFGIRLKKRFGG